MTVLEDFQFELDDVVFGFGADITVEDAGFDPGTADVVAGDVDYDSRDGTAFGRDYLRGPTWTWTLSTDMEDEAAALAAASELAAAWRGYTVRNRPGAVLALRYRIAGRTRVVYGRPRRWSAPPSNRIMSGYIPITCDFRVADHLTYDDAEQSVSIDMTPASEGGIIFPATFPVQTLGSGERDGSFTSGGDAEAYPVITISDAVNNPWVRHSDWRIDFDLSLVDGDVLEVDTRPWALTILKNGASVAGALKRRQRLQDIRIAPGAQEVTFGGQSASNSASMTLTWRDAYNGW